MELFQILADGVNAIAPTVIVLTFGFVVGVMWLGVCVLDVIRKVKSRRATAELRRQMRQYQAAVARDREAHAAEIAALREQLRIQGEQPKVFDAIAACRVERKKLMNRGEVELYRRLKDYAAARDGLRVFPQAPIGEILRVAPGGGTSDQRRKASQEMQCKRVDFVITDANGWPRAAIELQGTGHFQGTAAWRDQIKQALFRRADLPLLEVKPEDDDATLRERIDIALGHVEHVPTVARAASPIGSRAPA
jgi:hypothetical protein